MQEFDIIIVGGGPAGYNCAEYAAPTARSTRRTTGKASCWWRRKRWAAPA